MARLFYTQGLDSFQFDCNPDKYQRELPTSRTERTRRQSQYARRRQRGKQRQLSDRLKVGRRITHGHVPSSLPGGRGAWPLNPEVYHVSSHFSALAEVDVEQERKAILAGLLPTHPCPDHPGAHGSIHLDDVGSVEW